MEAFLARQPIFDVNLSVYGYELLYRSSSTQSAFQATDGDTASSSTLATALLGMGIGRITENRKAFINFTRNLIVNDVVSLFPKEYVIPEVLENIEPDEEVIAACRALKDKGYTLALDDFVFHEKFEPLIELADIIKVDFLLSSREECAAIAKKYLSRGIRFLAEKIETQADFESAKAMGYTLFQGYFFSKPVTMSTRAIAPNKMNYMQMVRKLSEPEPDFAEIAGIISRDVALTVELLKLVNSPAFAHRGKITSLQNALAFLGLDEVRKWLYFIFLRKISDDTPGELITNALVRARMLEIIATNGRMAGRREEMFLLGMLSLLDAIMGVPIAEILRDIPVSDDIRSALVDCSGSLSLWLEIVRLYEKAEWDLVTMLARPERLSEEHLSGAYLQAVEWVGHFVM